MIKFKFIILNDYKKDRVIIPHGHNCYEFVYYIRASGTFSIDTSNKSISSNYQKFYDENLSKLPSFPFSSHSFTLVPPNKLHNEFHKQAASIVAIGFDILDEGLVIEANNILDETHSILNFILKIVEEYKNKKYRYISIIETLITQMLIEIKRKVASVTEKKDAIDFAISYIDENFTTDIDINKLAYDTGYSADHFRLLFKQKKTLPPKSYILDKRIKMAKDLLINTSFPTTLISDYCGFDNVCYFTTMFKKITNTTPKAFRNSNIKLEDKI